MPSSVQLKLKLATEQKLKFELIQQPNAINEFHEKIIHPFWKNIKQTTPPSVYFRLFSLTFEYLEQRNFAPNRIETLAKKDNKDIPAELFSLFHAMLSFVKAKRQKKFAHAINVMKKWIAFEDKPSNASSAIAFRHFIKERLVACENQQKKMRAIIYQVLDYIIWPYNNYEGVQLGTTLVSKILRMIKGFRNWQRSATVRFRVLMGFLHQQLSFVSPEKQKDWKIQIADIEKIIQDNNKDSLLAQVLHDLPSIDEITSRFTNKGEQQALFAVLWMYLE